MCDRFVDAVCHGLKQCHAYKQDPYIVWWKYSGCDDCNSDKEHGEEKLKLVSEISNLERLTRYIS